MATPPLSTPVQLKLGAVNGVLTALGAPDSWEAVSTDAVSREGHLVLELMVRGPLAVAPGLLFEVRLSVGLDADQRLRTEDRTALSRMLALCEESAGRHGETLRDWCESTRNPVARLDPIGDRGRLICRGWRGGAAEAPLVLD